MGCKYQSPIGVDRYILDPTHGDRSQSYSKLGSRHSPGRNPRSGYRFRTLDGHFHGPAWSLLRMLSNMRPTVYLNFRKALFQAHCESMVLGLLRRRSHGFEVDPFGVSEKINSNLNALKQGPMQARQNSRASLQSYCASALI